MDNGGMHLRGMETAGKNILSLMMVGKKGPHRARVGGVMISRLVFPSLNSDIP